ncbi:uncharacterized protein LOC120449894 [Drosophila santomea]|uniref:uncharacterized protein LOC120449894 n=1 Tax=Drosophila santomea TaxID=129105 RepID=UPI001952BDD9|nr:uncharacterized protein LOC120449894 [Drosophila santomea]
MVTQSLAIKSPDGRWSQVQSIFGLISEIIYPAAAIMKYLALTIFVCLVAIAFVSAVPVDESLIGDNIYQPAFDDVQRPQDPQSLFKLKKLLKLKKLVG